MANLPRETCNALRVDLSLVQEATRNGVVPSRARAADRSWDLWTEFCLSLHQDTLLADVPESAVILLQIFAQRIRDGRLSKSRHPVRAGTVDDTVRQVGQAFAFMGAADPRLDQHGHIDLRLRRQSRSFLKIDPPPRRVKPIPIQILHHAFNMVIQDPHPKPSLLAIADMMAIAFYFLMRPGEYCSSSTEAHPFRVSDVELFCGPHLLPITHCTDRELQTATFVKLTFTTQKNSVAGECIGHGRSGHPLMCPVLAVVRRLLHLRQHRAAPDTPVHCFFASPGLPISSVTSRDVTDLLRRATAILGPSLGLSPLDIDARSLRASGAMSLLCADVDADKIKLLGRWRSDTMLRYLHVQAIPIMQNFARQMLSGGHYSFLPSQHIPLHMPTQAC